MWILFIALYVLNARCPQCTRVTTGAPRGFKPTTLVKNLESLLLLFMSHIHQQAQYFQSTSLCGCCFPVMAKRVPGLPSRDIGVWSSLKVVKSLHFQQLCSLPTMHIPRHFPICRWQTPPTGTTGSCLDEPLSCPIFISNWRMPMQRDCVGGAAVH